MLLPSILHLRPNASRQHSSLFQVRNWPNLCEKDRGKHEQLHRSTPSGLSARSRPNEKPGRQRPSRKSRLDACAAARLSFRHHQELTAFNLTTFLSLPFTGLRCVKTHRFLVGNVRGGNTRLLACASQWPVLSAPIRRSKWLALLAGSTPGRARLAIYIFTDSSRGGADTSPGGDLSKT